MASALLVLVVGCAGSGQASYSASASYTAPRLVLIEPDIQVVYDYEEPIFYTDSFYWRYDSGVWYRSNNHLRGWVRYETVPVRLRKIERPTAYIRYRGEARGQASTPQVRDHRDHQPPPPPPVVHTPPPVVHTPPPTKEERKDARQDAKEERKEAKAEAKADAKDDRKDAKEERKEAIAEAKADAKDDRKDAKEERKDAAKAAKKKKK